MHGPEVVTPALATPAVQGAQGGGYGELLLTSLLVLALVGGAAWLGLRLVARWLEGRRVGTGVTVVGRVPLEPRRALYVVEAGGRRLLVGSSEGGVTLLTELAVEPGALAGAAEEGGAAATGGRARSFGDLLSLAARQVRGRRAAREAASAAAARAEGEAAAGAGAVRRARAPGEAAADPAAAVGPARGAAPEGLDGDDLARARQRDVA